MASNLWVQARSREETQFEGEAKSVSTVNDKGILDILPSHENFISIVKDHLIIAVQDGKSVKIDLSGPAVVRVVENRVYIYLVSARPSYQL